MAKTSLNQHLLKKYNCRIVVTFKFTPYFWFRSVQIYPVFSIATITTGILSHTLTFLYEEA